MSAPKQPAPARDATRFRIDVIDARGEVVRQLRVADEHCAYLRATEILLTDPRAYEVLTTDTQPEPGQVWRVLRSRYGTGGVEHVHLPHANTPDADLCA